MTLGELEAAPMREVFVFLLGWAGLAGLVVGGVGGNLAVRHWPAQVDGVLAAAMTPVAVVTASATLLFSNASARLSGDGDMTRERWRVQVVVSFSYVVLTAAYFGLALFGLSMPGGTSGKEYVVAVAYACLGAVLGGMGVMPIRLLELGKDESGGSEVE